MPARRHTLNAMGFTTDPRVGAVVSVVLIILGVVMLTTGSADSAGWGWLFLVVGVLGLVANIGLYARTRRR